MHTRRVKETMLGRYILAACLAICFALCFGAGTAFNKYVGLSATVAFVKAPAARLRMLRRDWNSFQQLQYTQDQSGVDLPRYVETSLLPLVINKKRLSELVSSGEIRWRDYGDRRDCSYHGSTWQLLPL